MTLNETINHYLELAKINEMKAKLDAVETEIVGTYSKYTNGDANKYMSIQEQCFEKAREFRQLAEWLKKLQRYEFEISECKAILDRPTPDVTENDRKRAMYVLQTFPDVRGDER